MALSQMEVFNQYIMQTTIETLAQMVDKFNAASNGAIMLTTDGFTGDFLQQSFYAAIHGARRRVNRHSPNGSVPPVDLTQLKHSTVKVAGGFGPVRFEPSQMTWLNKPTAEGVEVASRNFAEALLQDQLNTAVLALVAAIGNQGADTVIDVSAAKNVDYLAINESHALFGDHSAQLVASVMDGMAYHTFIGQNITNKDRLFVAGNVQVVDILGRVTIVTDAPALFTPAPPSPSTDPALRRVLSLVAGAAMVHDSRDLISNIQTSNGKERIETTLQVDYTFGVGLQGYSWDEANGGKSPGDEDLGTGANWTKVASSVKQTAGVMAVGKA